MSDQQQARREVMAGLRSLPRAYPATFGAVAAALIFGPVLVAVSSVEAWVPARHSVPLLAALSAVLILTGILLDAFSGYCYARRRL